MPSKPRLHRSHEPAKPLDDRPNSAARGYGRRWREYRAAFLRENPLCCECLKDDRVEAATVVDHITPHRGNEQLFWDRKNHQPLCKWHHDRKTGSGE